MSKKLMHEITEAFVESDLRPLLRALDDNIVWKSAASVKDGTLRFAGIHTGIRDVRAALATIAADFRLLRFKPIEIEESGEIVWGMFYTTIESRKTHRRVNFNCVLRWRVRKGKVVEHQAFFDTALVLKAAQLPDKKSS